MVTEASHSPKVNLIATRMQSYVHERKLSVCKWTYWCSVIVTMSHELLHSLLLLLLPAIPGIANVHALRHSQHPSPRHPPLPEPPFSQLLLPSHPPLLSLLTISTNLLLRVVDSSTMIKVNLHFPIILCHQNTDLAVLDSLVVMGRFLDTSSVNQSE